MTRNSHIEGRYILLAAVITSMTTIGASFLKEKLNRENKNSAEKLEELQMVITEKADSHSSTREFVTKYVEDTIVGEIENDNKLDITALAGIYTFGQVKFLLKKS